MDSSDIEHGLRDFYDHEGWNIDPRGVSTDARLFGDLRACAAAYLTTCRRRIGAHLPRRGKLILDVASGPVQYPEYLEYSAGFEKRVCADISIVALRQARARLANRGLYVGSSIVRLPFAGNSFDAVISLHTIYHVDERHQEAAVRELIRVAKPGAPVVILYSNPDRWLLRVKRWFAPTRSKPGIYFHAHPLDWWNRFRDQCRVTLESNQSLAGQESRLLIPGVLSRVLFPLLMWAEARWPRLALRAGAYPTIILVK